MAYPVGLRKVSIAIKREDGGGSRRENKIGKNDFRDGDVGGAVVGLSTRLVDLRKNSTGQLVPSYVSHIQLNISNYIVFDTLKVCRNTDLPGHSNHKLQMVK